MVTADPDNVVFARPGVSVQRPGNAKPDDLNFDIPATDQGSTWDLDPNGDGDLVIPDDLSGSLEFIPTDGNGFLTLQVESQDSQDFSVTWRNIKSDGSNASSDFDQGVDPDLVDSYFFTNFSVSSDRHQVVLSSDVGAGVQNRVSGTITVHQ